MSKEHVDITTTGLPSQTAITTDLPSQTAITTDLPPQAAPGQQPSRETATRPKEIGGPKGPEPTRYGDWERNGRVSDF